MSPGKLIRQQTRILEAEAALLEQFRAMSKTDGGRMSDFGKKLLAIAKKEGVQQAYMARLLGITPGAVSQHYAK